MRPEVFGCLCVLGASSTGLLTLSLQDHEGYNGLYSA